MAKWRKKPVVIEAIQITNEIGSLSEMPEWAEDACMTSTLTKVHETIGDDEIVCRGWNIESLEGTMRADLGDYIIRGIKGEIYACKPDVFAATYEPAD